jgi:hypothetical protein
MSEALRRPDAIPPIKGKREKGSRLSELTNTSSEKVMLSQARLVIKEFGAESDVVTGVLRGERAET